MSSIENKRPVTERRDFKLDLSKCEVRSADGDSPATFSGYAAVFNSLSVPLGNFRERIQPGAFRTAVEDGQDVRFLINHDSNLLLGRTASGTVTLVEDEIGLRVECELGNQTYAQDLVESMKRGDINQMSFGFVTRSDDWKEKDAETGLPIRELIEADLFDVSVVTYPAYQDTTAEVRSYIEEHNPELLERAKRAAEDLEELNVIETPDTDTESELDRARQAFEEARALAGVRIEENHDQCDGVAVVWNFNDELQSCHTTREAAEAQVEAMTSGAAGAARNEVTINVKVEGLDELRELQERVGKTLSQTNADKISEATDLLKSVLEAAGAIATDDGAVPLVELNAKEPKTEWLRKAADAEMVSAEIVTALEERGWTWDDDWSLWQLTCILEAASCFLLYERDEDEDDGPASVAMKAIMSQVADLIVSKVSEVEQNSDDLDVETREADTAERERRLRLMELELTV